MRVRPETRTAVRLNAAAVLVVEALVTVVRTLSPPEQAPSVNSRPRHLASQLLLYVTLFAPQTSPIGSKAHACKH